MKMIFVMSLLVCVSHTAFATSPEECMKFIRSLEEVNFWLGYSPEYRLGEDEISEFRRAIDNEPEIVNCKDEYGNTPLTSSFSRDHCPLVRVAHELLDRNALADLPETDYDLSPLYYAVDALGTYWGPKESFDKIILRCDKELFHSNTEDGMKAVIQRLISLGADPNRKSHNGVTIEDSAHRNGIQWPLVN